MYSLVKDLPIVIQKTLSSIGYKRSDIQIIVSEKVSPQDAGGSGQRGFFSMINLVTSDVKTTCGSWGGANIFNKDNIVDNLDKEVPLNDGIVAIKGSVGNKIYATLHISNANIINTLPESKATDRQKWILWVMETFNSMGRKNEFSRANKSPSTKEFEELKDLGYITISKNGAMRITTNGKNALNRVGLQHFPYSD